MDCELEERIAVASAIAAAAAAGLPIGIFLRENILKSSSPATTSRKEDIILSWKL